MLNYRNDPRFRTERLMILYSTPMSIVVLIGVGFLSASQLKSQKEEMARLIRRTPEDPIPVTIPASAVERGKKRSLRKITRSQGRIRTGAQIRHPAFRPLRIFSG